VRSGRSDLLTWGPCPTPSDTLALLLSCAYFLLGDADGAGGNGNARRAPVGEMEGIFAGHVVFEMLLAFPHDLMQPHIPKVWYWCAAEQAVKVASKVASTMVPCGTTHQHTLHMYVLTHACRS
jgi:hypothetical protein